MTQEQGISFTRGYELAQKAFAQLPVLPQTSSEWVTFFRQTSQGQEDLYCIDGMAAFITKMEIKGVKIGQLNRQLNVLNKAADHYGHDSRWVDSLLQCPPPGIKRGPVLEIPSEMRPDYSFDSFRYGSGKGKLGRIYMAEVGMHMYLPHCDVYALDDPTRIICVGDQLEETSVKVSELLQVLQHLLDPERAKEGLSQAIERCAKFESEATNLAHLMLQNNLGVISLSQCSWHRVNYQHIHAESLYLALDENDHIQVWLELTPWHKDIENPFDATAAGFDVSGFIKEAINRIANTK